MPEDASAVPLAPVQSKDDSFVFPDYEPAIDSGVHVKFDFNIGARIQVDKDAHDPVHIALFDADTGNVLHSAVVKPGYGVGCSKKYYIRYRLEVRTPNGTLLYTHELSLAGQNVLVQMPYKGALGDSIAWFTAVAAFADRSQAKVHVLMPPYVAELFREQYPELVFETPETARKGRFYATYCLGLFFHGDTDWQPHDFRLVSLAGTAAAILGMEDFEEKPPKVRARPSPVKGRYVVVATQASNHAKHWCNPQGWRLVIGNLLARGYRVLCIDREHEVGVDDVWHHMPWGVEDWTGNRPLQERVDVIAGADFFIGLSSGLSWLAWCCGVPLVLISGICMPFGEFRTPYRVQNRCVCHGCWNDTRYEFSHTDFMWCPVHKGTPRAYECTKAISARMVLDAIRRIPGVLGVNAGASVTTEPTDKGNDTEDMAQQRGEGPRQQ